MTAPDNLPPYPPVPDGFDRWEYRGIAWKVRAVKYAVLSDYQPDRWQVMKECSGPSGAEWCRYLEAVRDPQPQSKGDLLRMDFINSLSQPLWGDTFGAEWPIYDIDVQTGLLRLDVCGKLEVKHIADLRGIRDSDGNRYEVDVFYSDYEEEHQPQPPPDAVGFTEQDMLEDPEYQAFVSQVAETCHAEDAPCDGCLAGGMCDEAPLGRATPGPAPEGAVTLVCLGDLYADSCSVCGKRAEWGIASQSGPHGCTEAIKAGRCFCDDHLPKVTREPSDKPTPPEPSGSDEIQIYQRTCVHHTDAERATIKCPVCLERERDEALRRAEAAETLLLAVLEKTHCDSHNRQAALCEIRDIIVDHRMAYEGITDEDLFIPHSERP